MVSCTSLTWLEPVCWQAMISFQAHLALTKNEFINQVCVWLIVIDGQIDGPVKDLADLAFSHPYTPHLLTSVAFFPFGCLKLVGFTT